MSKIKYKEQRKNKKLNEFVDEEKVEEKKDDNRRK